MKYAFRQHSLLLILILCVTFSFSTSCSPTPPTGNGGSDQDTAGTVDSSDIDVEALTQGDPIEGEEPIDLEPGETTTYDVTLKDNAYVVSQETVGMLLEVSDDGSFYRFDPLAEEVAGLATGDVVIFYGMSIRKIVSVITASDAIIVKTESATLDEAIQDGEIAWEKNVDFANIADLELDTGADESFSIVGVDTVVGAGSSKSQVRSRTLKVEGKVQGWDVSVEIEPTSNRLNLKLSATRTISGIMIAAIRGDGWVSDFTSCGCLHYSGGSLSTMEIRNESMRGEMVVRWSAFNTDNIPLTAFVQLSIPASIPIPIQIGPIPVLIKLKAIARVVPEIRFQGSSSMGDFKATYSASQGFRVEDNAVSTTGNLETGDIGVNGETVSAGSIVTALGVGIEFPRLEVSVLGEFASAFVTIDTYAYSLYDPGLISASTPCQEGMASVKAIAGYNLSFLGASISDQTEIWRKEFTHALNGVFCPEE